MEDISNRTLALFLVAAIVVSIAGTLAVLETAKKSPAGFQATGFATNTSDGLVNLTVSKSIMIELNDSIINFGNCEVLNAAAWGYLASNANSTAVNLNCDNTSSWNTTHGDWIEVVNIGNVNVTVVVKSSINSTDFFDAYSNPADVGTAWFKYWTINEAINPGCVGSVQSTHTLFADTVTEYQACTDLRAGAQVDGENPGFRLYVDVNITGTVTGTQDTTTLTFIAEDATV
ncbi:MAG: hypothetical protein AB7V77_02450 [Candidatus Woesearchaeota archaeon]